MSQISNRFYVTALEDGTTLHGNLVSDKSLTQAWNGSAAVPSWENTSDSPTIYLTLLSGATLVVPSTYKWYYNGTQVATDSTASSDARFLKTTKSVTYGSQTETMPALKIIKNLANTTNVDVDTITFEGEYTINGSGVSFSATAQIRISAITANGNLGVINFHNGISDITQVGQTITLYGVLYGGSTGTEVAGYTTKWYLNESSTGTNGSTYDGHANAFRVTESQVVDHATVRCEFYKGSDLMYTAYASIDDMQDPEYMYIQYNGNNGNAASLRKGDTATFQIWVGTREDPSVLGGASTPKYSTIKVKLLNGSGNTITATGLPTGIPDPDSQGWRTLTMSGGKATITPHYDTVNGNGKNITGIVIAYTS